MLEGCTDILECEEILAKATNNVRLLGEIPLTDNDIEHLSSLVKQIISTSVARGTRYLKANAPTCLACFLVSMGRFYDKESGYWPVLVKRIGLSDLNWQMKWGKFFLDFLNKNHLPKFDEEVGLTYVTPILGHVCIPDNCLEEYFERVLVPLVQRDLINPYDRDEIIYDLEVKRKINRNRLELEKKRAEQDGDIRSIQKEIKAYKHQIEKHQTIASLLAEEEECQRRKITLHGLEDSEATRLTLLDQINDVTSRLQQLTSEGKQLLGEIEEFKEQYKPVFDHEAQIESAIHDLRKLTQELAQARLNETNVLEIVTSSWKSLSSEPWDDQLGAQISQLDLVQLLDLLKQYHELQVQKKQIQEDVKNLQASVKKTKRSSNFVLPLLTFIRKILLWFGKKDFVRPPSELKKRQAAFLETAESIQHNHTTIREALAGFPIKEELLENPSIDLYEGFIAVDTAYQQLVETRRMRNELDEQNNRLTNQVKVLVTTLGIATDGNLSTWIGSLIKVLKDGQRLKTVALKAKQDLEEEVRPKLATTRMVYQNLMENLEKLDHHLEELGDGSVQQGLKKIQEYNQQQAKVAQTRQEINARYPDFTLIEGEIRDKGWSAIKADFETTLEELGSRIRARKSELKSVNAEVEKYPVQYFGIDEPIRRFLLYGGVMAEDFLVNSIKLFTEIKAGETVEHAPDWNLRQSVVNQLQEWWELIESREEHKRESEEEVNLPTGERFRAPRIVFDKTTIEILVKFPTQRCLGPDRGTTICLEVYAADSQKPDYVERLNLYKRSKGLVETTLQEFILPALSRSYRFLLTSGESIIHEWEIGIPGEGIHYMAFFADTGKYVNDVNLPKAPLIIVIKEGVAISPQECILFEGGHLFESWKEFSWYEVDLSEIEEFHLRYNHERSLSIPLVSYSASSITLIGGTFLEGASSDERPIYTISPQKIHIPVSNCADLSLMRISLLTDEGHSNRMSKHYQVSDLLDIVDDHIEEGWLDISLESDMLLGRNPIGGYCLRVFKSPYLDWTHSFAVIPDLEITFDRAFYPPYKDEAAIVKATIVLPQFCTLTLDKPAYLTPEGNNAHLLQTQILKDEFTGVIEGSSSAESKVTIPLTIFIPKMKWRIQGLNDAQFEEWIDHVKEELWLGDWFEVQELFLIIQTPQIFNGNISIDLPGNSVEIKGETFRDHKIRFDLKALEDKLRNGPAVETFNLSLTNNSAESPNFPLFFVRTRWQADNIKYLPYPEDDTKRINISWIEKGRAEQVIVRLLRLSDNDFILVKDQVVFQGKQEVVFRLKNVEFPSGTYLIHLAPYDPWSPLPKFIPINAPNSQLIEINWEIPKDIISLKSVCVEVHSNDKRVYFLPQDFYKIRIVGKVKNWKLPEDFKVENIDHILVTSYNEDWFVGNLEVKGVPEVIAHLADTNPVKFEFDPQRNVVTCIEDRHGDGAVYCWDCNSLFWYYETVLKEKKKHGKHNYPPIEFSITRKTE